jgi:vacuolar-type H+-ATPase subunit H
MSVEDIRSLVKQEKESEVQLKRAKEEATRIVEQAKIEADKTLNDVEDHRYLSKLLEDEMKKIEQKKRTLENESNKVMENLQTAASKNMEKAVAFILGMVFGE